MVTEPNSYDVIRPYSFGERDYAILERLNPGASLIVPGVWPCVIVSLKSNHGHARKALPNLFEIFIPTRTAQLVEVTGDHDRRSYHYRMGMVAFTPPGIHWEYQWEGIIEGVIFFIEKDTVRRAVRDFFDEDLDDLNWRTALADASDALAHLGLDIASQVADDLRAGQAHVELLMSAFLSIAIRRYSETEHRKTAHLGKLSPQVMRALSYIDRDLVRIHSLNQICETSGASTAQLNRLFRQELGHSVWDFLTQKRLSRASIMLQETQIELNLVAQKCGFGTRKNFDRQFKKAYACTPAQFRTRSTKTT